MLFPWLVPVHFSISRILAKPLVILPGIYVPPMLIAFQRPPQPNNIIFCPNLSTLRTSPCNTRPRSFSLPAIPLSPGTFYLLLVAHFTSGKPTNYFSFSSGAGSDKPHFDDERRLSHDGAKISSGDASSSAMAGGDSSNHSSSVMEEATENDLQVFPHILHYLAKFYLA